MRGVSLLAAFMLSASVARSAGPEAAGVFFLTYAVISLLSTAGRFGADNLALRLLGGDTDTPWSDLRRLLAIVVVAATAASLIGGVAFTFLIGSTVGAWLSLAVATCIFAQAISVTCGTVLRGLGMLATGVFAELGSLPLVATGIIAASSLHAEGGLQLSAAVVALVVAAWLTTAWTFPVAVRAARRRLADQIAPVPPREFVVSHVRRLSSMMGTSLLAYAMVWAPVFVLSVVADMAHVSYYSVALRVANLVALLPTIQISYLAPEFARRFYAHDIEGLNDVAGSAALRVSLITALPTVALVVFSDSVVQVLFGAEFGPAVPIMVILSFSVFVVMTLGQVNQLMLLCGLEGTALVLTSGAIGVWATVGLLLGSFGGAVAVAYLSAAIGIAYASIAALQLNRRRDIRSWAKLTRER